MRVKTNKTRSGAAPSIKTSRVRAAAAERGEEIEASDSTSDLYSRIYAVVKSVPRGRVATFGQVAALADAPRHARLVGYALHALAVDSDVPWHRIVNARGTISLRSNGLGHEDLQARLLRRESVRFVDGVIALDRYQWRQFAETPPPRKPR